VFDFLWVPGFCGLEGLEKTPLINQKMTMSFSSSTTEVGGHHEGQFACTTLCLRALGLGEALECRVAERELTAPTLWSIILEEYYHGIRHLTSSRMSLMHLAPHQAFDSWLIFRRATRVRARCSRT
jgi:hypothetical protein